MTKVIYRLSISFIIAAFTVMMVFPLQTVYAGALTTPRDYLKRLDPSLVAGEQHQVFFTTLGAVTGGVGVNKVILVFPDADDAKWCYTVGTGDLVITGITDPTGDTETATVLPGTLTGACTQGSGASSYDTITVSGVNDLTATTKYGVRIAEATSTKLGTPLASTTGLITVKTNNGTSDVDTGTLAVDIITDDEIAVSATVNPLLTVELDTNTCALATLDTTNVNKCAIQSTVTTNAGSGYISMAYFNATLTNAASATIPVTTGGNIVAGTEEYGVSTEDTDATIVTWSPASCTTGAATSDATALTTSEQSFAKSAGPVSAEQMTLCHMASITATTDAGVYTSTTTMATTALF